MAYVLGNGFIIYDGGSMPVISYAIPTIPVNVLSATKRNFDITIDEIANIISSNLEKGGEKIIINEDLLGIPGFLPALKDAIGTASIVMDVQASLRYASASEGTLSYINMRPNLTTAFELNAHKAVITVTDSRTFDDEFFHESLYESFKNYCNRGISKERFKSELFNYSAIITLNMLLIDPRYEITEDIYGEMPVNAYHQSFKYVFTNDLTIDAFFKLIYRQLSAFISNCLSKGWYTLVKSPLLGYRHLQERLYQLFSNEQITLLSDLDLASVNLDNRETTMQGIPTFIEISSVPPISGLLLPASLWILSESDNLALQFSLEGKTYKLDWSKLKKGFKDSAYKTGGRQLLKYNLSFNKDEFRYVHIVARDITGNEVYQTVRV